MAEIYRVIKRASLQPKNQFLLPGLCTAIKNMRGVDTSS